MIASADIVAVAQTYIGTPWIHHGRSRIGIDCVGLLIAVGRDLGLEIDDYRSYHRNISAVKFEELLSKHTRRIDVKDCEIGDIVGFSVVRADRLQHCGFRSNIGIIHASHSSSGGSVIEEPMSSSLIKRIHSVWRF